MKFLVLLFLFTLLNCSSYAIVHPNKVKSVVSDKPQKEPSWKEEHWIEQPLNHFNLFENRTWNMRYFINDEFFQKGMPLFVEIGGEWTVNGSYISRGQMFELAKTHNGLLIATEHRYYGKSLPFSDDFSTDNLKYLQIEQALEDLVYLIEKLKSSTPGLENSKVVVHGCSYAGMLASWVRLRFPNIVDIGYASSAPLGVELDYPEYYETLNDVYANISVSCIDTIRKGFNDTINLLKTDDGRKIVYGALRNWKCTSAENMHPLRLIRTMLYVLNVQYDPVQYEEVGCLAMSMDTDELSDFERLARFIVLKSNDAGRCPPTRISAEYRRQMTAWIYQTCTEMGFFQTLNRENVRHPFSVDHPAETSLQLCEYLFDERKITEKLLQTGIERVIRRYGGKHPQVTKLLTVHGTADPWRALGISEEMNPETPVVILRGSHCVDCTSRKDDPIEIIEGRKIIRDIVSEWLNEM